MTEHTVNSVVTLDLKMQICSNTTDILGNSLSLIQFLLLLMCHLIHEKHNVKRANCTRLTSSEQEYTECTHASSTASLLLQCTLCSEPHWAISGKMTSCPIADKPSSITATSTLEVCFKVNSHVALVLTYFRPLNICETVTTILIGSHLFFLCVTDHVFEHCVPDPIFPISLVVFHHTTISSNFISHWS